VRTRGGGGGGREGEGFGWGGGAEVVEAEVEVGGGGGLCVCHIPLISFSPPSLRNPVVTKMRPSRSRRCVCVCVCVCWHTLLISSSPSLRHHLVTRLAAATAAAARAAEVTARGAGVRGWGGLEDAAKQQQVCVCVWHTPLRPYLLTSFSKTRSVHQANSSSKFFFVYYYVFVVRPGRSRPLTKRSRPPFIFEFQ
jgi:hypothetical protein